MFLGFYFWIRPCRTSNTHSEVHLNAGVFISVVLWLMDLHLSHSGGLVSTEMKAVNTVTMGDASGWKHVLPMDRSRDTKDLLFTWFFILSDQRLPVSLNTPSPLSCDQSAVYFHPQQFQCDRSLCHLMEVSIPSLLALVLVSITSWVKDLTL